MHVRLLHGINATCLAVDCGMALPLPGRKLTPEAGNVSGIPWIAMSLPRYHATVDDASKLRAGTETVLSCGNFLTFGRAVSEEIAEGLMLGCHHFCSEGLHSGDFLGPLLCCPFPRQRHSTTLATHHFHRSISVLLSLKTPSSCQSGLAHEALAAAISAKHNKGPQTASKDCKSTKTARTKTATEDTRNLEVTPTPQVNAVAPKDNKDSGGKKLGQHELSIRRSDGLAMSGYMRG